MDIKDNSEFSRGEQEKLEKLKRDVDAGNRNEFATSSARLRNDAPSS